jgi:hypothetical protein
VFLGFLILGFVSKAPLGLLLGFVLIFISPSLLGFFLGFGSRVFFWGFLRYLVIFFC